ncbi:PRC-barrel domain-containing protein [Kribbella sp.]|uniref:PRC-barrel domain-containing protein n=1 Tax=Kribbella sp. TaxID=1871183 RepID=UPI002D2B7178|nr:PRC-barrel domain-containing protein [Kribbella sp.]HZX05772.1 PRC-barrel domain-containing protein [Kribbella sp.]
MTSKDRDAHTLVRLTDVGLELADLADDVRGRKVVDRNGDEVGKVDGLIVDEAERRVRFLEVGSGGLFGLGQRRLMVPVEAITRVEDDVVHVSQDRDQVAGGPTYDPEVVVERRYYENVYGYYGYPPYWGPFPR